MLQLFIDSILILYFTKDFKILPTMDEKNSRLRYVLRVKIWHSVKMGLY